MADILGPAPEAMSNADIIQRFDGSLRQLTKSATDPTYDYERINLINQARLQWMMIRGMQNNQLGWNQDEYGGMQADYIPFDYGTPQEETGADVKLCPPVNFLGGDCYKFMAVMGSSSPRVKGVADDLRNNEEVQSAHCADVNVRDLWIKNKIDRRWKIAAFHQYATGPCFIRGFWNTDPVKYGQSVEPKIEVVDGPGGIPVPQVTGETTYDNGDAEVSFHSVLEVSIPWEAKELRNNPLCLERMMSKWALLSRYAGKDGEPGPLDKYRNGTVPDDNLTGSSVAAAEARQAVSNPSGTAQTKQPNQWRFTEWWIPPYLYESIFSDEARQIVQAQFARGLYIARVGGITVEIDEREVCEEWTVVPVNRGEKIMDRPVCADNVPLQRAINDMIGMAIETILRAITQTLVDNNLIDRQAMSTKEAIPAEMILTAMPVDGDLRDKIFQIPPAHLSDQLIPLLDKIRAMGQDISGVRPELSGGGAPTSTFREAKQRKDQALAQLAPQSQAMREAAEDLARILVDLRSKYGSGTVKVQHRGAYGIETDVADMADLQTSGWHPESDDQFPLTLSDKRDELYSILKEFPEGVQQALSLLDPINVEEVLELIQIPGFASAIEEQKQKTISDIERLLAGAPIPGAPGPDGTPGPPQPSVPVDVYDNHQLAAQILARWLVSPRGQKEKGKLGFENVEAFFNAQAAAAAPPPPPVPPPLKGSVSWTGKLEDFPALVPQILKGEGLNAPLPPSAPVNVPPQPSTPGPPPPPGGMPPQQGAPTSSLPPLPPLNGPPAGAPSLHVGAP